MKFIGDEKAVIQLNNELTVVTLNLNERSKGNRQKASKLKG